MTTLLVNGERREVDADPGMPLLWALRDLLDLKGAKYGCGRGLCGSCTVHMDGEAVSSCTTPLSAAEGKAIITIEGLSPTGSHSLQEAWIELNVPQCGYCQPGQIMSAAALLNRNSSPSDEEIDAAMTGNICRCGAYQRIRAAIHRAAGTAAELDGGAR
jgi:isoquinoline 1-oxidoreductase alpha subunit